jgi:hypothetical protein
VFQSTFLLLSQFGLNSSAGNIARKFQYQFGVRFFIARWLSLDTGVKYLSSAKGIADSEVNVGLNMMVPLKTGS